MLQLCKTHDLISIDDFVDTATFPFSEEPNLYYSTDDEILTIFLRPCKFYPKSALELMRRIAEFKEKNAALLYNLLPSSEQDALLKNNIVNVLTTRDHKNRRVLLLNCGKLWDPSRVTADQMFRILYMIHTMAVLEPETQVVINWIKRYAVCKGWSYVRGGLRPSNWRCRIQVYRETDRKKERIHNV